MLFAARLSSIVPPDFAPSSSLQYLAFHPNPNLPEAIQPVDDTFLRGFKLAPGKAPGFEGSFGFLPTDGFFSKPDKKLSTASPATQVATQTLKIKVTAKLGGATPGTPSRGAAQSSSSVTQQGPANVGPGYPGTTSSTTIRLTVGKKVRLLPSPYEVERAADLNPASVSKK